MPQHQHKQLSQAGADFIADFEGFRAEPYNDADQPPNATIGFGHMIHSGPVTATDEAQHRGGMSRDAALGLLRQDADGCVTALNTHLDVALNQAQFDALVSMAFNIGAGGMESSSLLRDINGGKLVTELDALPPSERHSAQDTIRGAFLMWDRGPQGVLPGLEARRTKEAHLFMTGQY